ncbi:helix-turn-helix transcriptional regulator [uncultured Alistipes sp.]|uniref:helix-turn-helix transcriptional regulator n=1 Tax=uncultured Alistipes sp. TaxID=538949 RepID=UPI00272B03D0|nr:helix-turn-helix transcriptional regulator [uncultured Alistipes sp.]
MEHAGNQLRKLIKEKGLTQEKAAEKLGITRQTIGQWLKRPVFDANTLHEISSKLGVSLGSEVDPKLDNINLPREVFDKISQLIDTVCSQQNTIADQHRTIDRLVSSQKNSSDARSVDNAGSAVAG